MKKNTFSFLFIFLFLFAAPSHALVKSIGFTNTAKTATGVTAVVKYAGNGKVFTKIIGIGKQSLGAVIKKRAFSPWGAVIVAAAVAADYILDETTGTINTGIPEGASSTRNGICFQPLHVTSNFSQSLSACIASLPAIYHPITPTTCGQFPAFIHGQTGVCFTRDETGTFVGGWGVEFAPAYTGNPADYLEAALDPLTDTEVADALLPQIATELLPDVLTDPATGHPDELIDEITQAATELDIEIDLLADGDPTNDPSVRTPFDSYEEHTATNTTNNTNTQTQAEKVDYTFSTNTFQYDTTLENIELLDPHEAMNAAKTEIEAFTEKVGVTASGSKCKFSHTVTLGNKSKLANIDFCQFSSSFSAIGSVILAISYLFSGLIVMGVKA